MRLVRYPGKGRPNKTDAENLEELLMLAQAAISIANTQRRVFDRVLEGIQRKGDSKLPAELTRAKRNHAYEVTVVDQFYQLGQQSFAHHGSVAMWERPMNKGRVGRPESVDVALFNRKGAGEESRIEFGVYTKAKLKKDAKKLIQLNGMRAAGYPVVSNYVILWEDRRSALTGDSIKEWLVRCQKHASDLSDSTMTVALRLVSSADLFCEDLANPRVSDVAIFSVKETVTSGVAPATTYAGGPGLS